VMAVAVGTFNTLRAGQGRYTYCRESERTPESLALPSHQVHLTKAPELRVVY
jgi:hypothetical protein